MRIRRTWLFVLIAVGVASGCAPRYNVLQHFGEATSDLGRHGSGRAYVAYETCLSIQALQRAQRRVRGQPTKDLAAEIARCKPKRIMGLALSRTGKALNAFGGALQALARKSRKDYTKKVAVVGDTVVDVSGLKKQHKAFKHLGKLTGKIITWSVRIYTIWKIGKVLKSSEKDVQEILALLESLVRRYEWGLKRHLAAIQAVENDPMFAQKGEAALQHVLVETHLRRWRIHRHRFLLFRRVLERLRETHKILVQAARQKLTEARLLRLVRAVKLLYSEVSEFRRLSRALNASPE